MNIFSKNNSGTNTYSKPAPCFFVNRYLGRWYEIGRLPTWFQIYCNRSVAHYYLIDQNTIGIHNICYSRVSAKTKEDKCHEICGEEEVSCSCGCASSNTWPRSTCCCPADCKCNCYHRGKEEKSSEEKVAAEAEKETDNNELGTWEQSDIHGKGEILNAAASSIYPNTMAALRVGFGSIGDISKVGSWFGFRPKANYLIHETDYDNFSIVGSPDRKGLYILARTPTLPQNIIEGILCRCRRLGYDTSRMVWDNDSENVAGENLRALSWSEPSSYLAGYTVLKHSLGKYFG